MPLLARSSSVCSVLAFFLFACGSADGVTDDGTNSDSAEDEGEGEEVGTIDSPVLSQTETGDPAALEVQPLDVDAVNGFIDVRGVGDAAWSGTHESPARAAEFGKALNNFDRTGTSYRGHLNFINWETVVGTTCSRWHAPYSRGKSYAFLSRPEALTQAYEAGFNLVGLSNNHSRDCYDNEGEIRSSKISVPAMESVSAGKNWLWHGVSATESGEKEVAIGTFPINGKNVKVAFGSGYTGRPTCPLATCKNELESLMRALGEADADLRILSLHSVGKTDQIELARLGVRFVEEYGGDVVYGSGPHVWSRVQIARKKNGKPGVVFESLGNFIHPGVGTQARNIIGRALFDEKTLELKQVQVVPVAGAGASLRFNTAANLADPTLVGNIRFTTSAAIKGGYVNVRQAP